MIFSEETVGGWSASWPVRTWPRLTRLSKVPGYPLEVLVKHLSTA